MVRKLRHRNTSLSIESFLLLTGGIKESYRAYQRWAATQPAAEKSMPGLSDYSPQQMFWISAGQVWCSVYREAGD